MESKYYEATVKISFKEVLNAIQYFVNELNRKDICMNDATTLEACANVIRYKISIE